ncbi:hypothetical protein [Acrocarpospora phusangensis]|uniref:hypothetical protein n=1 Tax=Acrocarpospora phusangensis TaxID=1070424 RepID=UPI0019518B83|nr:hypothetical protein [Acrocarpospora phusangensis]
MDWRQFSVAILGQVFSWPCAVLVAFLIFRKPIAGLLGKLSSVEGFGQKITFGQILSQVEEDVETLVARTGASSAEPSIPDLGAARWSGTSFAPTRVSGTIQRRPLKSSPGELLKAHGPAGAVITSWKAVEDALRRLASVDQVSSRLASYSRESDLIASTPTAKLVRVLVTADIVPASLERVFQDLRRLRNDVAHGGHSPVEGEAIAYAQAALDVSDALDSIATVVRQDVLNRQMEETFGTEPSPLPYPDIEP